MTSMSTAWTSPEAALRDLAPRTRSKAERHLRDAGIGTPLHRPASAMSFGPIFRFVVGAEYSARVVSAHLVTRALSAA
jgi:hypothetical protein